MTNAIALLVSESGGGFNPLSLNDGGGLFWTVVIFLVALVPIWKMVMGPITRAMEERDDKLASAIVSAEKASREAESAKNEVVGRLREAELEAAKLLDAARGRAETVERQLKDQAAKEAAAMLERAKSEIRGEQDRAISAIRREVVDLSLHAAGQVLHRKVDAQDDRRLVEELVSGASKGGRT